MAPVVCGVCRGFLPDADYFYYDDDDTDTGPLTVCVCHCAHLRDRSGTLVLFLACFFFLSADHNEVFPFQKSKQTQTDFVSC